MTRPRLLTFDCYGTLIDWVSGCRRYLAALLAGTGADVRVAEFHDEWYQRHALRHSRGPFKPYRRVLKDSLQDALRAAGVEPRPDDGDDFGDALAESEPFPDVPGTLGHLSEHYPLALVSNSQQDIISHSVAKLGVPIRHVVTAEDVRAYKPDPRPFERVLAQSGCSPQEVVHVAQSQDVDLPASVPLGMTTVWVNRHGQRRRAGVPAPQVECADLTPLPELLLTERR
jgi:2-haloacid dehalogenase